MSRDYYECNTHSLSCHLSSWSPLLDRLSIRPFSHQCSVGALAFLAAAALVLVLAANGFAEDFQILPYHSMSFRSYIIADIRGFVVGLLVALMVSGQLRGRKILPDDYAPLTPR